MVAIAERDVVASVIGPAMSPDGRLAAIPRGMAVLYGGDRVTTVPDAITDAFRAGDRLVVVQTTGDVLHIPATVSLIVDGAVARARAAFTRLSTLSDKSIDAFYTAFAARLADDGIWQSIAVANRDDVDRARARGRSTTRLVADVKMRARMIEALHLWRDMSGRREVAVETVAHDGWRVDQVIAGLGVIGFVFEGRPNVFADATGVLRSGNTAAMRIGSDALGTARAIASLALDPAIQEAGLPEGAVTLIDSPDRAAGWALFSNPDVALAVARGSGAAVAQLGAVARQSGVPASLHGTGGAWIVADTTAEATWLDQAVYHSLDSKKCNTLNTLCIVEPAAARLVPVALEALRRRGEHLGHGFKVHVTPGAVSFVPAALFDTTAAMRRAEGAVVESIAARAGMEACGTEWEWEGTPEITLVVVPDVAMAVDLFNQHSPHFVASLLSADQARQEWFFRAVDAPFVGNGFTRWVDGQFALRRPELGLSSWQYGRLFARGGILTGDGVFTLRLRVTQETPDVHV